MNHIVATALERGPRTELLAMVAAASTLIATLFSQNAFAADWPQYRGPHRDGSTSETVSPAVWPEEGPPERWRANVGAGFSSTSVASGRLVTMGNTEDTDHVVCLDAETGDELWRHSYACPLDDHLFEGGPTSTPAIDGDSVYTFSRRGHVFCLDLADGSVRWSANVHADAEAPMPTWGFASSPLVHGDLLLLGAGANGLALDKADGEIVWASADAEAGYASPVLLENGAEPLALFLSGRELTAVDLDTGRPVWSHRWLTRYGVNAADPLLFGDRLFLSSGYGKGAALVDVSGESPEELWRSRDMRNQFSTGILRDGYVYGLDGDTTDYARLRCLELETGEIQWTHEGVGSGSLILADDDLLVLTEEGDLLVAPLSPNEFEPVASAHVLDGKCWTMPALAEGRLYCRNADGDIVCVAVRGTTAIH